MPVSLSDLRNDSRKIRIFFSGDDLNIEVFPHRLTNDVLDQFRDASEDRDYDAMARAFGQVVVSWDLLGDDGEPMPIDGDTFRVISTSIINHIWNEIADAVTPKSRRQNKR